MSNRQYFVYVVELDKQLLNFQKFRDANPQYITGKPCVYVGQSTKTPIERFAQHKRGYKGNRWVKKYGLHLLYDHFDGYNPLKTRKEAEEKEAWLAEMLRSKGYGVWWG